MTARMLRSLRQQLFVADDLAAQPVVFLEDFVAFQGGQLAELQADHRVGLGFGHAVDGPGRRSRFCRAAKCSAPRARSSTAAATSRFCKRYLGLGPARRTAANADHLVQRRNGDQLAFEDVAAPLGLAQQVLGPPADDLHAVAQEFLQHLLERQRPRPAVDQGQQDDADRLLQRRELVELVEHQLRVGVAFEVEDEPDRLAAAGAGFVADFADALDPLVLDQLADRLVQAVAGLLVGDLV